jgi:hypothetical protein
MHIQYFFLLIAMCVAQTLHAEDPNAGKMGLYRLDEVRVSVYTKDGYYKWAVLDLAKNSEYIISSTQLGPDKIIVQISDKNSKILGGIPLDISTNQCYVISFEAPKWVVYTGGVVNAKYNPYRRSFAEVKQEFMGKDPKEVARGSLTAK